MTLTQLGAFVLVARLGSVRAAARVLGVSEPAVSGALAALRQHLGDQLLVRSPTGMELTPGGQRLLGIASQMVRLGAEAEAAIRDAQGAPELLRVVATATMGESVAAALLAAFAARTGGVETSLGLTTTEEMPVLLAERLADVGLGPRLAGLASTPVMRCQLVVVAHPAHRFLQAGGSVSARSLGGCDWLVGPSGADPGSDVGRLLAALRIPEPRVRVFPSEAAALSATSDAQGVAPVIAHLVAGEVARGTLARVPVPGTPGDLLWYATVSPRERGSPAAHRFRQFLTTSPATQIMHRADSSVPVARFRPPVYVTLWS